MDRSPPVGEVFRTFLRLGVTAFGGPVAHLAHFRRDIVERRSWLDDGAYARIVAYGQFLPGPTSSQVGFLLGWQRAGLAGALAAWCGFTLPSAILLTIAALVFAGISADGAWLAGMKVAVLAIVAQAVVAMARSLCPDLRRAAIALLVATTCLLSSATWMPLVALVGAGTCGVILLPATARSGAGGLPCPSLRFSLGCLALLAVLTVTTVMVVILGAGPLVTTGAICFQAGGLVFGGGHVVLPLLREPLVGGGLLSDSSFLAGYGLAQVVPGPLFTVAAWLGAQVAGPLGAATALVAIFAPGLLLALGCLRFYQAVLARPWAHRLVAGLNAGVVGLLGAALYQPIGIEALHSPWDAGLALAACMLLIRWQVPAWAVVGGCCLVTTVW